MQIAKRLLMEPFVHFLALGALIFVVYSALGSNPVQQDDEIIYISGDRIEQLRGSFSRVWKRDPTGEELTNLTEEFVREEVLYRSALELGLERNDPVIRNRLRYKLEFLSDSGAQLLDPPDEVLAQYAAARPDRYLEEPRYTFHQIYLGEQPTAAEVETVRNAALRIGPGKEFEELGQRTMLPARMVNASPQEIAARFGEAFVPFLSNSPEQNWSGWYQSLAARCRRTTRQTTVF